MRDSIWSQTRGSFSISMWGPMKARAYQGYSSQATWVVLVVELMVAEDFCGGGIGGLDGGVAVEETVGLVEVDGLGYVGGDAGVCADASELRYAVDEYGEKDGDAGVFELPGHGDGLGGSPTVAVEDDAGVLLFGEAEDAVVVDVEQALDLAEGLWAVGVLEDFGVDAGGVALAEMEGHLDFAVDGVGLLDAATEEADHDGGGEGGFFRQGFFDEGIAGAGRCGGG